MQRGLLIIFPQWANQPLIQQARPAARAQSAREMKRFALPWSPSATRRGGRAVSADIGAEA